MLLVADVLSGETAAVVIASVIGALWGVPAVLGWRQVADARKERIAEIEAAQGRAEAQIVVLNQTIAELEKLPDLTIIREEVRARHAEVTGCLRELKEAVDEIARTVEATAAKWG